jgi:putative DNA primase/helicase
MTPKIDNFLDEIVGRAPPFIRALIEDIPEEIDPVELDRRLAEEVYPLLGALSGTARDAYLDLVCQRWNLKKRTVRREIDAAEDDQDAANEDDEDGFVRGDEAELADRLLELLGARPNLVADLGRMWRFSEKLWRPLDRDELRRETKRFAGARFGKAKGGLRLTARMVDGAIQLAHAEVARRGFFSEATPGVSFNNGFVAIEGDAIVLRESSPEYGARHCHPFDYDPNARAELLQEFLDDVFADCAEDERATRIMFLQEHAGACLVGIAPRYQRCAILLGPGGNAKSTTADVIYRGALPTGAVVSLPPQLWGERFQMWRLLDALGNVVDEIPETEIIKTGVFKAVISGEPVHVEQKHRDPFEARMRAGHVFCANALPPTRDLTDGFFRRFVIIGFARTFHDAPNCRRDIAARIRTECTPGIVTWALEGAARLLRQGDYTVPRSSAEAVAEWRRASDSVAMFIRARTEPIQGPWDRGTKAKVLYRAYGTWATDNRHTPVSSKTFATRMEASGQGSRHMSDAWYYPVRLRAEE